MSDDRSKYYLGQRLSLKHQACTVRYIGTVAEKPGTWLGVEWDDTDRGKHNGTHNGEIYFKCRSTAPTCASFLRQTQAWEAPRTFLQALREKYMPEYDPSKAEVIYISGKQAEEVGFEKFQQRQAKLQGIHVLVLDHMRIRHQVPPPEDEAKSIAEICHGITELDLSGNLFESFEEIHDLCKRLPKLRGLTLAGNRFSVHGQDTPSPLFGVKTLGLSKTLFDEAELQALLEHAFPSLDTLSLARNEYSGPLNFRVPPHISRLDFSDNNFAVLSDLAALASKTTNLETLILKRNKIAAISLDSTLNTCLYVRELDLTYNNIDTFDFFHNFNTETFPTLHHLRITGNLLYKSLVSADGRPLSSEDGYMLTIARVPQLEYLNYSKITEKERLNAETYYLSQIAIEIGNAPEGAEETVLRRHPRYRSLCEEYGEPVIKRKDKGQHIDPNSLAARLVAVTFKLSDDTLLHVSKRQWRERIPKSFSIYTVHGMVGKRLKQMPLGLRLILETNERDPVGMRNAYNGPEWWDSSDEEEDAGEDEFVKREVELVPGTRALATYVDGLEANVRVELRHAEHNPRSKGNG